MFLRELHIHRCTLSFRMAACHSFRQTVLIAAEQLAAQTIVKKSSVLLSPISRRVNMPCIRLVPTLTLIKGS